MEKLVKKRVIKTNDNMEKLAEFDGLGEAKRDINVISKEVYLNAIFNNKKYKRFY
jgi:hypothetical protein